MLAKIFTSIGLIFSLIFQNFGFPSIPRNEDLILKAVLVADIHADADFARDRTNLMREIFSAIGRTQNDADLLVMAGDITNSGDLREYINLFNCLNVYSRIFHRLPEIGNHDSWHHSDDPDFKKAERYFKAFCRWNGIFTKKLYYEKTVKEIPFICLGVEAGDFDDPYHSPEQLEWFRKQLSSACATGKPVFVVCHKPVSHLGDNAEEIERIMLDAAETAVAPIVMVSGHRHELDDKTFTQPAERLIYLNLPSMEYTGDGGLGFVAEVSAHELTLTGMNFFTHTPLEGYTYRFEY
mgnify:CR=1 FL=1